MIQPIVALVPTCVFLRPCLWSYVLLPRVLPTSPNGRAYCCISWFCCLYYLLFFLFVCSFCCVLVFVYYVIIFLSVSVLCFCIVLPCAYYIYRFCLFILFGKCRVPLMDNPQVVPAVQPRAAPCRRRRWRHCGLRRIIWGAASSTTPWNCGASSSMGATERRRKLADLHRTTLLTEIVAARSLGKRVWSTVYIATWQRSLVLC